MFRYLKEFNLYYLLKFLFSGSLVLIHKNANVTIGKSLRIVRSKVIISRDSKFEVKDNVYLSGVNLLVNGSVYFDKCVIVQNLSEASKLFFSVNGRCKVSEFSRIRCKIWVRFNGDLYIGSHTNINENSEIRCDEKVHIGDYIQCSYDVVIWDTNTHNIYDFEKRRNLTSENFPKFGLEIEKPSTKPVYIGNDCWIGRRSSILKGTVIGDRCIVGYNTMIINKNIQVNSTIYPESKNVIITNNI